jgi:hypothetical protein
MFDELLAKEYCDSNPIDRIEGIWLYPDDKVTVLISKSNDNLPGDYSIKVINSEDNSLLPGEILGYVENSSMPDKFSITLYTSRKNLRLFRKKKCSASLTNQDESLIIEAKSIGIKINPLGLLPHFWRYVRYQSSDPTSKTPHGMRKIYPSYDGNGSSRFSPRYL